MGARHFFFALLGVGAVWVGSIAGCDGRSFVGDLNPDGGMGGSQGGTGGSTPTGSGGDFGGSGGDFGGSGGWIGTGGNPGAGGQAGFPWGAGGQGGEAWGSGGSTGAGGIPGAGGQGGSPPAPCPTPGVLNTPTTVPAFRAAVSRRWQKCGGSFDGIGGGSDGLEIKPNDRYQPLRRNEAGQLEPLTGVEHEGSIIYGMTDFGAVQTTFRSDLNEIFVAAPVITRDPTMLIMKTATSDFRYVLPDQ